MKGSQFAGIALAFAMTFALTGCSDKTANSPAPTTSTQVEGTQNAGTAASARRASANQQRREYMYYASSDGKVHDAHEDTTLSQRVKGAVDDAGNAARRAADAAGDMVRGALDHAGDTMKKAAEDLTGK